MRTALIALFIALSSSANADNLAPAYHLVCYTDPFTTTFSLSQKAPGEDLVGTVIFHYGTDYAPAISGTFTPHDLPRLAERAELVKQMKPRMSFRWPGKKCVIGEKGRLECFGSEDVQDGENGVKFKPFALYTTRISEEGIAGKTDYLKITLSIYSGQKEALVEMSYPVEGCELNGVRMAPKKGSSLPGILSSAAPRF